MPEDGEHNEPVPESADAR